MDVAQIRQLTTHWIDKLPGNESTVVSGFGVWPLLALLAEVADGPAREELTQVASGSYLDVPDTPDLRLALGLWTRSDVPLQPGLLVPSAMRGILSGQEAVDAWVADRTGGLIDRMPVQIDDSVLLLLASALAVQTSWVLPFDSSPRGSAWWLTRRDPDLDSVQRVESSNGPLTVVTVIGEGEVDVRLIVGEKQGSRAEVLAAGLQAATGIPGSVLLAEAAPDSSPAPSVQVASSTSPVPTVDLSMPSFELDADHDLLDYPDVFGLRTATDQTRGHFPGLSPTPLAVGRAKQAVMARFSAKGFEAAAATAFSLRAGSARRPLPPAGKKLCVDLDGPFGFIAVHRPTGAPLVAGWVTEDAWRAVRTRTIATDAVPEHLWPQSIS